MAEGERWGNIFMVHFWRTLKYEWLYLNDYHEVRKLESGLRKYMRFYNEQRLHSSLSYRTPQEVHFTNPSSMAVHALTNLAASVVLTLGSTIGFDAEELDTRLKSDTEQREASVK